MTFKEYLKTRRITDTIQGDFTRDAQSDPYFPDIRSWPELERYLSGRVERDVRGNVLEAGRKVWLAYTARAKKEGWDTLKAKARNAPLTAGRDGWQDRHGEIEDTPEDDGKDRARRS